jgi:glyoxylase I family protein
MHEIHRPECDSTILYLDAGSAIIELFSFPAPPPRAARPEACGLRHLAFTVDDFDGVVSRLHEMGVETEPARIDARTGRRLTFFKDPDNLPLEICESQM